MAQNTTTASLTVSTAAIADYDAFEWMWNKRDDQALAITFTDFDNDPDTGDGVSLRLSYPRGNGTVYLDLTDGTELSTSKDGSGDPAVVTTDSDIAYTDLPEDRTYYAEFLRHALGDATGASAQVLARGRITIQHSVWLNTTATTDTQTTFVSGPSSSTDNAIARFDGTGGNTLQNSTATIDDSGNLSVAGNIAVTGTVDGIDIATDVAANTAKTTNATHTGHVTGATATTLQKEAITDQALVTGVSGDHVLIADASDSDNLKKINVSDLLAGSGDMTTATYDPAGYASQLAAESELASTANGKGASLIGIEDSAAQITATTVEGALAELAAGGGGDSWGDPVDADVVPDTDSSRSLGSTLKRWLTGWFDSLTVGGDINLGGNLVQDGAADYIATGGIRFHDEGAQPSIDLDSDSLQLFSGDATTQVNVQNSGVDVTGDISQPTGDFNQAADTQVVETGGLHYPGGGGGIVDMDADGVQVISADGSIAATVNDTNITLLMGDNAAGHKLTLIDSDLNEVWNCNSNGKVTHVAAGADLDLNGNGIDNASYLEIQGLSSGVVGISGPAGAASGDLTLPNGTDTLVGRASTDTLTNKTFDANGTGNSLSNVETADLAAGSKSGSDATLITGTAGTAGNLLEWNADGDAVDSGVASTYWSPSSFICHNSAGLVAEDTSRIEVVPPGVTSIDSFRLIAKDGSGNVVSGTITVELRTKAWASGTWTDTVTGDKLSGTHPALSSATSLYNGSPGLGALTPGNLIQVGVLSVTGTDIKTAELKLVCS